MAKKAMAFRLSDAARDRLARVAVFEGKSATQIVEELILGDLELGPVSGAGPQIPVSGSGAAERARLNDLKNRELAARVGGVDPEKIAAFQKKVGMTVFDKRRRRD